MKLLTTTIFNIDEELAENAMRSSLPVLVELFPHIKIKQNSLVIEPHDEYRGIIATFHFDYVDLDEKNHKNASRALHDAVNGIIRMQLWRTPTARISSETSTLTDV